MRGSMALASGQHHYLLVQNVSRFGVGGKTPGAPVRPGERVTVNLPNVGLFDGTVRWQGNGRVGIQLDRAIDPEKIQFYSDHLEPRETEYKVAERFRPVEKAWRPGLGKFGRKK